jgi:hypothetical protein
VYLYFVGNKLFGLSSFAIEEVDCRFPLSWGQVYPPAGGQKQGLQSQYFFF